MTHVYIIAGPTASGKSALALARAGKDNGVIINGDSMQVYGALPILTAQPTAQDRASVPHVLYGTMDPANKCSAALWRALACAEIAAAAASGRAAYIVGGTGFYLKALTDGLSPIPDVPASFRAQAAARLSELGHEKFHEDLRVLDPATAAILKTGDTQRLIRAREVLDATGKTLSYWQSLPPLKPPGEDLVFDVTLVLPARETLYARCDARFEAMIENGALDEVRDLVRQMELGALPANAPITNALGFAPLRDYLAGLTTREDAAARAKTETRNYAKRQVTWFRHQLKPRAQDLRISVWED